MPTLNKLGGLTAKEAIDAGKKRALAREEGPNNDEHLRKIGNTENKLVQEGNRDPKNKTRPTKNRKRGQQEGGRRTRRAPKRKTKGTHRR